MKGDLTKTCSAGLYMAQDCVFVFVPVCPPLDCLVAHVSAESHCVPSDVLLVRPSTVFANEHSALPNPSLLYPFFPPLSALISKRNTVRGQRGSNFCCFKFPKPHFCRYHFLSLSDFTFHLVTQPIA